MNKRKLYVSFKFCTLIACTIVTFLGCSRLNNLKESIQRRFQNTQKAEPGGTDSKASMSYFEVKRGPIEDRVELRGKLLASERVEIRADKRVRLNAPKVKIYEKVKRGQIIFTVDTKDFETKRTETKERLDQLKVDLAAADAQLVYAVKQNDRKKLLVQKGISAKKELEDTEKQLVVAETSKKTKELDLRKAEREFQLAQQTVSSADVLSPIDGVVATVAPGGDEVGQGTVLAVIANPSTLSLFVNSDETYVMRMVPGFEVDIKTDSVPVNIFKGKVKSSSISAQSDVLLKSYETQIEVDPKLISSLGLKDGFEATMIGIFAKKESALTVPISAVKASGRENYVQIATKKGGSYTARSVKTGLKTDLEIEVLSGLSEGDVIAVVSKEQESL